MDKNIDEDKKRLPNRNSEVFHTQYWVISYFIASSIATATATVIPTMGLLPAPIRPIISMRERLYSFGDDFIEPSLRNRQQCFLVWLISCHKYDKI